MLLLLNPRKNNYRDAYCVLRECEGSRCDMSVVSPTSPGKRPGLVRGEESGGWAARVWLWALFN